MFSVDISAWSVRGRKNQLTVGGNLDSARTRFTGESQPADFTSDRGTTSSEAFGLETAAKARQELYSLYTQDVLAVTDSEELGNRDLRFLGWELEGTGVDLVVAPAITDVAGPRIAIRPVSSGRPRA